MKLRVMFGMILFFAGALAGDESEETRPHRSAKYGIEEHVSFFSRESVSSDKKLLRHGILMKRPNAQANVLICHGFMCDKYDVSFLHLVFRDYNTMTFDFRAHGDGTKDQCCTFGRNEAYDVIAAAQFMKNHPDLKSVPLIIYGFSMGAVATIIAGEIEKNLCQAMILDCPFDSSDKLLERGLSRVKMSFLGYEMGLPGCAMLKNYAYNSYVQSALKVILKTFAHMDSTQINTCLHPVYPEEAIKYIKVPVLIIGCINDDKAPEEAVKAIYDGAQGCKFLRIFDGRRHFDPIFFKLHEYIMTIEDFIRDFLDGSLSKKRRQKIVKDVSSCIPAAV